MLDLVEVRRRLLPAQVLAYAPGYGVPDAAAALVALFAERCAPSAGDGLRLAGSRYLEQQRVARRRRHRVRWGAEALVVDVAAAPAPATPLVTPYTVEIRQLFGIEPGSTFKPGHPDATFDHLSRPGRREVALAVARFGRYPKGLLVDPRTGRTQSARVVDDYDEAIGRHHLWETWGDLPAEGLPKSTC